MNEIAEYKVIELDKYGGKLSPSTRKHKILAKEEILIKIYGSTIHPADLMFLMGEYGDEKPSVFPLIPGFEGCGEIVQIGEGLSRSLIHKRVSVSSAFQRDGTFQGLWGEYHYTKLTNCMVFDSEISYDKICFALINPMTAIGFLDTLRKNKSKSVIQDGASGALGKMFTRLCSKEGITSLNIVRNQKHFLPLKKLGADYVISTDESKWHNTLEILAKELNATVFFDCVGGNLAGKILSLLPNNSTLYNFGNLELKKLGIDSSSLIFKNKKVEGWWLLNWLKNLSSEEKKQWFNYIAEDIKKGSDLFLTEISHEFNLKQINDAIKHYSTSMSEGKVLLRPKF